MILDFIIIFLLLISLLVGWKVGFFRYILKIASVFTGLIFSLLLTNPFAELLIITPFGKNLENGILQNILEHSGPSDLTNSDALHHLLSELGIPKILHANLTSLLSSFVETEEIVHSLAHLIATAAMHIIAFFIILIGTSLIIFILKKIVDSIRENDVINKIDSVVGMFFSLGIFTLVIFSFIALTSVSLNIGFINNAIGAFCNEQLEQSFGVFKYFYNQNIIINFFKIIF